jgi:hypothetical protein
LDCIQHGLSQQLPEVLRFFTETDMDRKTNAVVSDHSGGPVQENQQSERIIACLLDMFANLQSYASECPTQLTL